MSEQITIRLSDPMASELDQLVAEGEFPSRAEVVRAAIRQLLEQQRRQRIGNAIVEGYRRVPQTDEEVATAEAAAIRSIHQEPW